MPSTGEIRAFAHKYRSLVALGTAALFAELAYAMLNLSAMPMYVEGVLNEGAALGIIMATFLLTEAASRPAFGALGDRIGRKPLMIAGPAVTCITAYLTIKFQSPWVLVGLRALDGVGSGALWTSAFAVIGDIVEEKNRSSAMSILNVTYMSGIALGFLLGGAANDAFHSKLASFYLVSILLALTVLIFALFFPNDAGKSHRHPEPIHGTPLENPTLEEPAPFKLSVLLRSFKEIPEMIVLACVIFLGIGMLMPIIKLYAVQHLRMSETTFGAAVAPAAAAMGICAVPLGRLGDKYGKCVAVCWGLFASALAMWVLALFKNLFSLHIYVLFAGLAGVILGLGFTVAFPAWMALVSMSTSPSRRGEVIGAIGMAQGLAAIVGTSLGGFIYFSDVVSFPLLGVRHFNAPFWFAAILLSIGTVMAFTWMCGRHGSKDDGDGITVLQRKLVVGAAIAGLVWMLVWIPYRYLTPVPPGRVAMSWVYELVSRKPVKAMKYALPHAGHWDGLAVSREKSRVYAKWEGKKGIYDLGFTQVVSADRAEVPVEFTFPGTHIKNKTELIRLCKLESGEWKVCGVRSAK